MAGPDAGFSGVFTGGDSGNADRAGHLRHPGAASSVDEQQHAAGHQHRACEPAWNGACAGHRRNLSQHRSAAGVCGTGVYCHDHYPLLRKRWAVKKKFLRRGNAVIEAALVLPILLYLAFGTVEFGYFFYVKNNLQGAAREGVRAGIPPGATNTDVNSAILSQMTAAGLQASGYTVTTTPSNISGLSPGSSVTG